MNQVCCPLPSSLVSDIGSGNEFEKVLTQIIIWGRDLLL